MTATDQLIQHKNKKDNIEKITFKTTSHYAALKFIASCLIGRSRLNTIKIRTD